MQDCIQRLMETTTAEFLIYIKERDKLLDKPQASSLAEGAMTAHVSLPTVAVDDIRTRNSDKKRC
jgi:hypothetical protein